MSAKKITSADLVVLPPSTTQCLTLSPEAVRVRKNGIEFRSKESFQPWTEMTLTLQKAGESKKINCTGVIVACHGSPQQGYNISMLFTNLSRQSQVRLQSYS